jgi:kumamolisin
MTDTDDSSGIVDSLDLRPLPGSDRRPADGVTVPGSSLPPETLIEVTLVLRRRAEVPESALLTVLSREEFVRAYGADPADVDLVTGTVSSLGLRVLEVDAPSRRVRVSGTAAVVSTIFGTSLELVTIPKTGDTGGVTFRHRTGGLSVPAAISGVLTAVLGLDDRPQARACFQIAAGDAVAASYTPPQLGVVYRFPTGTDGTGQAIAILELGGGYGQADLDTYFQRLGIPTPTVTAVGVDGAVNTPGQDPNGADGEVLLDIEVIGALAPKAEIVVYFAPNTDAGFFDALSRAVHAATAPVAISISWGQSEDDWTAQARTAFDQALTDAAAFGVSVTAASGDDGSTDRATDGRPHADFPASSPHVLGCGGTRLDADPGTGQVHSEVVWNNGAGKGATGGGVSDVFPLPSWQTTAGVPALPGGPGRGVPDVAGNADPQTGYQIRVDGKDVVIGGTSAVAPLWAALIARLAQATGRSFGLLQPALYAGLTPGSVARGFRDITIGSNGGFVAVPGWDACTGLGVPDGEQLRTILQGPKPA